MHSHSNFNDKNFLSLIFTALHLRVQGSLSHEQNVCPPVCQTPGLWQNEWNLCTHSYTKWNSIHPSFM